jgi:ArsR family transcriptional regulator
MSPYEDPELFKIHASYCGIFSNEKRLRMLWLLAEKEYSVNELAKEVGINASNVSQHLRVMKDKGIVIERKEGQQVHYSITNKKFIEGYKLIREGIIETLQQQVKTFTK